MSVERLQQLSDAMKCWLQSNVKDVVRLIARLLWGTKVGELGLEAYRGFHSLGLLAQTHSAWDRALEPTAKRQRGLDSDDEEDLSANEDSST